MIVYTYAEFGMFCLKNKQENHWCNASKVVVKEIWREKW